MVESTNAAEEVKPKTDEAESQENKVTTNWADDDDEVEEGDREKDIGGNVPVAKKEPEAPKIIPPKTKREKNIFGDFVVTKINIKEREIPTFVGPDEEESEEESDSEPEPQNDDADEEKKIVEPVKQISKKDKKK